MDQCDFSGLKSGFQESAEVAVAGFEGAVYIQPLEVLIDCLGSVPEMSVKW